MVPMALAVLLSFPLAPAVRWLRRLHIGRVAAVTLTVLIAFLATLGFAAVIVQEISTLAQRNRNTVPTSRPKFARFRRSHRVAGSCTA
jgi:predicted PurR-regulated permease PerM